MDGRKPRRDSARPISTEDLLKRVALAPSVTVSKVVAMLLAIHGAQERTLVHIGKRPLYTIVGR